VENIDNMKELEWGPMSVHLLSNYEHQFRPTDTANVDVRSPDLKHRRQMVYAKYFARNDMFSARPNYFDMPGIRSADCKRIARFKMGSHHLRVVTGACFLLITNRTCTRCHHTTEIDDEIHLLFNCDTGRNACNEDGDLQLILDTSADNPRSLLAHTNEKISHLFVSHCMKTVDTAQQL
jgi:hypothetical protein